MEYSSDYPDIRDYPCKGNFNCINCSMMNNCELRERELQRMHECAEHFARVLDARSACRW